MKKEFKEYNYVIEISYPRKVTNAQLTQLTHKFNRVIKYLELEFDLQVEHKKMSREGIVILVNKDFEQDKVASYILEYVEPQNLSIFTNK